MLTMYRLLTGMLFPFVLLHLLYRLWQGKEDKERFLERLGFASCARPAGNILWMHAASVGEAFSILPLIEGTQKRYPSYSIIVTTGTVSSAKLLESRLPAGVIHQYVPIDMRSCIVRFLRTWRPTAVLWVESELWPLMLKEIKDYCPLWLINGRMSPDSYRRWQRFSPMVKHILGCFTGGFAQSAQDMERFKMLGMHNVRYVGNLKYTAAPLPISETKSAALHMMLQNRPVWLAASTHPGEEEQLIQVHTLLKQQYPTILTIIIPRHSIRGPSILALVKRTGLQGAERMLDDPITPSTDIYVADTMGELGIFYDRVPIVFIGGTLVPHGGQNMLEPARMGCAIVIGPHYTNFLEVVASLQRAQAITIIQSVQELASYVSTMLSSDDKRQEMQEAAKKIAVRSSDMIPMMLTTIFASVVTPTSSVKEQL